MIKTVNGLKLHLPDDITRIRVRQSTAAASIERYNKSMVVTGDRSNSFQMLATVIEDKDLKTTTYDAKPLILHLPGLNIEAYSCLPVIITIAVIDRKEFKYKESEGQLVIACPTNSTEKDVVDYFIKNKLTYFNITGGSNNKVGNVVLYELSEEVTRAYDSHGKFTIDQYEFPTIDSGEVIRSFNTLIRNLFPDFSLVKIGDQTQARTQDYIEYTLIEFGKYRRPYIEELSRKTLLSHVRVRLEFVIKDTVKYMNLLHAFRAVELLTNQKTFLTKDRKGNEWKCSMDWTDVLSDVNPENARGNYSRQAGQSIIIECDIRYFSVPFTRTEFYKIDEINVVYKFITT